MSHLFEYFATSDDEDPTPTVDAKQLPGDLTLSTVCFLVYSTLRHRPEVKCLSGLSTNNVFEVPGCTLLELCSIVDSKRGESQTTGIYTQSSSQSTPKQVGNVDSSYGRPSVSVRLRPCSTRTATSVIGPGSSARLGFLFPPTHPSYHHTNHYWERLGMSVTWDAGDLEIRKLGMSETWEWSLGMSET